MFVDFVWLTSNHMRSSGDFWDKSLSWFLKILKFWFWKFWNLEFAKMHSDNFSQIALPNMWLVHIVSYEKIYIKSACYTIR